jgi:hypothetical protein
MAAAPVGTVPGTFQALPEPLRLPHGSVRGVIAIFVTVAYGYHLLVQGTSVPPVLVNSVVVVMAFYFGSHAMSGPPAPIPGQPTPRRPWIVRALLLLGFVGLAGWFLSRNPSLKGIPADLLSVLEVLGGYVAGLGVSWIVHRRAHESSGRKRLATFARDALAAGALALTAYICIVLVTGQPSVFATRTPDALSLVVTFYFGSRVIGR